MHRKVREMVVLSSLDLVAQGTTRVSERPTKLSCFKLSSVVCTVFMCVVIVVRGLMQSCYE
jgi:L-asparagine transporter-like permease